MYIYILLLKKVQTQVICTTMVSWMIPIVGQSKTDFMHRQVMHPLRHGGSHFYKSTSCTWWYIIMLNILSTAESNNVRLYLYQWSRPRGCFTTVSCALKTISRNLCFAEIVLVMRISSSNYVHVHKAVLWAHIQNFQLKIININVISGIAHFREVILESSRNVNEVIIEILTSTERPIPQQSTRAVCIMLSSLTPARLAWNFKLVIFKLF